MSRRWISLCFIFLICGFYLGLLVSLAYYQIDPFIYQSEYRGPKEGNQESQFKDNIQGDAIDHPYYAPSVQQSTQQAEEEPLSLGMINVYLQLCWNLLLESLPKSTCMLGESHVALCFSPFYLLP